MKTSIKRIPTNHADIFYKEIITGSNKVLDKVFIIRYEDSIRNFEC